MKLYEYHFTQKYHKCYTLYPYKPRVHVMGQGQIVDRHITHKL